VLAAFPHCEIGPHTSLFRVVRQGRGPWWFGSSLGGRFDLPVPEGTCYLATDPLAALLEAIGADRTDGGVSADFLRERRLRRLTLPHTVTLADLTSRQAAGFGITGEIDTIVPYELPQAWATRLREAGSEGLLYWLRHDPSRSPGIALFGPHGERTRWRRWREQPIAEDLRARLAAECGIEVREAPRADQLTLKKAPVKS